MLRFGCLAAFAISLATACNAQVANVLASDTDAGAPPAGAACTSDEECNDNPLLSSLRGQCKSGVCVCNPGVATTASGKCGGATTASGGSTVDAGPAPPLDPSSFCTGANARMAINGDEVAILDVKGKAIAMNCCDAGKLTIATGRFQALFTVFWRFMVSSATAMKPVDVAKLPQGSGLELDLGCDPTTTSCATASPEDRFDTGFQGTIDYTPTSTGADTSYCLTVSEPAASPHTVLHTVQIYVPHIAATY